MGILSASAATAGREALRRQLTRRRPDHIVPRQRNNGLRLAPGVMAEFHLDRLEQQVEHLLRQLERLRDENASLRASQEHLVAERAELIEKTELARSKVEAMVSRLKSMEEQL
ncbi:TIGR02449 family protein [Thiohalocapsa halophila]